MRLSCAKCGAHYEVDASAVPEGGREVQCSACGHEWFEVPKAPLRLDPPKPAPDPAPEMPRPAAAIPRTPPPVPDDFRAILREEAALETAARMREGTAAPDPVPAPRRKGGFVTGFLLAVLPLAILAGLYLGAPRLAAEAPDLAEPLARYTAWVDQGRLALDGVVARIRSN